MRRLKHILVIAAIGLSAVAVAACGSSGKSTGSASANGQAAAAGSNQGNAPAPQSVKLVVKTDEEHATKGPDGNWHDAFLPADFTVHAGATVTVTVYNYDDGPHSFTSPSLGVDAKVPGGSADSPSKTTFKFTAPTSAGKFLWWCRPPCDPYAMKTLGLMRGYVTVVA